MVPLFIGMIGLNLYIQSPSAHARIQQELGSALHIPLQITNATVTPWSGLKISGLTVPGEDGTTLEANSFSANYRFWPLLHGRLAIKRMVLDGPRMVWIQNANGRWQLPGVGANEKKEPSDSKPGKVEKPKSEQESSKVSIEMLEIRGGSIELTDLQKERVAMASGVNMEYGLNAADRAEGNISIARLQWGEFIVFSDLQSKFQYRDGTLSLPSLEGGLAGGRVKASLEVKMEEKGAPYKIELSFENADLARMGLDAGWQPEQASGTLKGKISLRGSSKKLKRAEGLGELTLVNGQFRQLELFQTIGQVLQISELSNLRLNNGHALFRIGDERVFIDQILLESTDLALVAGGNAKFDGKLALQASLGVSEKLVKQLPGMVKENFGETDAKGFRSVTFEITGNVDRPRSNLLDKIVGRQVPSQFEDFVSGLFGGSKKKEKDKAKDAEKDLKKEKEKKEKKARKKAEAMAAMTKVTPAATPAPGGARPATNPPSSDIKPTPVVPVPPVAPVAPVTVPVPVPQAEP